MKGAVEKLDMKVMSSVWENTPVSNAEVEPILAEFEKNLEFQQGNITMPGEQERTDQLARLWEEYRGSFESFSQVPEEGLPLDEIGCDHSLCLHRFGCRSDAVRCIRLPAQALHA
jgi:hypothetical protein